MNKQFLKKICLFVVTFLTFGAAFGNQCIAYYLDLNSNGISAPVLSRIDYINKHNIVGNFRYKILSKLLSSESTSISDQKYIESVLAQNDDYIPESVLTGRVSGSVFNKVKEISNVNDSTGNTQKALFKKLIFEDETQQLFGNIYMIINNMKQKDQVDFYPFIYRFFESSKIKSMTPEEAFEAATIMAYKNSWDLFKSFEAKYNQAIWRYFENNFSSLNDTDVDLLVSGLRETQIGIPILHEGGTLGFDEGITYWSKKQVSQRIKSYN